MQATCVWAAALVFMVVTGCGSSRQATPLAPNSGGEVVVSGGTPSTGGAAATGSIAVTGGATHATGGQDDTASASCDEVRSSVHDQLHAIQHGADTSCSQDADCAEVEIRASCYFECISVLASEDGRSAVDERVAALERDYCRDEAGEPQCSDPRTVSCPARPSGDVIRCIENTCEWTRPGCAAGCAVGPDGLCHGDPECDGCPYEIEHAHDRPCMSEDQVCTGGYEPCDLSITCVRRSEGQLVYHASVCL